MTKKVIGYLIWVLVCLVIGGLIGYYFGVQVGFRQAQTAEKNIVNPLNKVETFKNPFSYTNPFANVKLNPFAD